MRLGFGNEPRGYDRPIARDMRLGDIRVSPQQLETMALALALMLAVFAALAFTRIGKAMRASADNPELAALKGIRPERVAMMASFVGMGLVGVGGMLLGLDSSIDPLTGTRILLSIFAAAVLGGLGSAPGAVLGAFLIGMAEELSVLVVGSHYRAAVGFVAILVRADACGRAGCLGGEGVLMRVADHAELPPLHRHGRRHLRAAGAQPQSDLGRRGHGQSRPRRLLRRRRLCLGAADDRGPRADRRRLAAGADRGRRGRAGRHALDHAPARGLSRHRHPGLRRSRAPARRQRDLADPRHRRHLGHSRSVEGGAGAGLQRRLFPDRARGALAVVFFLMRRIDRSPYGRALRAIREDAQVAQVAGKPVLRFKTEAFALSAAIAGLAGALYGHFTSYIAPDLFLPLITVYIFLAVASGGTGRPAGALVGAYLVMTLLESSRFFVELIPGVTAVQRAALKELLIAVALILVLRLKPSGVLPERIPPAPRPAQGATS